MEWEKQISEIAQGAVCRSSILSLLRVAVLNPGLDYRNVLLVFNRNPQASCVCGRMAWEGMGGVVKEGAEGVVLALPKIQYVDGKYILKIYSVKGYGMEDTAGRDVSVEPQIHNIADKITQRTGAVWEMVGSDAMGDRAGRGYYDAGQHVFYLVKGSAGEQLARDCLGLYVDYCMLQEGVADCLIKHAVSYLIYEHFRLKHTVIGALFKKLGEGSPEERLAFLQRVCSMGDRILSDLEGDILNFNETAILNDIMVTDRKEELLNLLGQAETDLAGTVVERDILELKGKIGCARVGVTERLYRLRTEKMLYSYPPVKLDMERDTGGCWAERM